MSISVKVFFIFRKYKSESIIFNNKYNIINVF